jgi:hypothetical protein
MKRIVCLLLIAMSATMLAVREGEAGEMRGMSLLENVRTGNVEAVRSMLASA